MNSKWAPEDRNPTLADAIGSGALPAKDGYYWLHNLSSEDKPLWRIVELGYSACARKRVAWWCGHYLTPETISEWKAVAFHGPLHPPNKEVSE